MNQNYYNNESYPDPTVYEALKNLSRVEKKKAPPFPKAEHPKRTRVWHNTKYELEKINDRKTIFKTGKIS